MECRYANHNSYIHFKKLLHDATHPGEDAPPLPHASTWFPSDPRDAANGRASQNPRNDTSANDVDDDDESDLEVTSERISIKCPITLRPMKEPVTSTECPHSFEKTAILEMIERSTMVIDGGCWRRGLERVLKCPVCGVVSCTDFCLLNLPGRTLHVTVFLGLVFSWLPHHLVFGGGRKDNPASIYLMTAAALNRNANLQIFHVKILTRTTLKEDPILIRKIKRLQAAQAQDPEDDFGSSPSHSDRTPGGTQRNAHEEVEVGSEDDTQSTIGKRAVRVKSEKATQSQGRGRGAWGTVSDEEDEDKGREEEGGEEEEEEEDEARRPPASSGGVIVDLGEGDEEEDEGDETGEED